MLLKHFSNIINIFLFPINYIADEGFRFDKRGFSCWIRQTCSGEDRLSRHDVIHFQFLFDVDNSI